MIRTGLENLILSPPAWLEKKRLGVLVNPASVDRDLSPTAHVLSRRFPGQIKALFSPQHGFFAAKQDNMIESQDVLDPELGVPAFSLYSETRKPLPQMLDLIDVLLVDLLDVGTRVYTFMYSLSYCMEEMGALGKKIVVLDRPNPVNGLQVEGNILEPEFASFVGRYPLPMRHGMTMGELALFFRDARGLACDLEVVPLTGWSRDMFYQDTGLFWVPPSPNLPTPCSALVYPGQVIWEGTNVSEGRGTTSPFEMFGAPYMDTRAVMETLGPDPAPGAVLRPCAFEPTSNKWAQDLCRGFFIHVKDPDRFKPYRASLDFLQAIIRRHGNDFAWKQPPYEYEYEKLPMDLILGSRELREGIENLENLDDLERSWEQPLESFLKQRKAVLLY